MTTPVELHTRRLALGISRETVAGVSGTLTFDLIRRGERFTSLVVYPAHVRAIEAIEEAASSLTEALIADATANTIDGAPVLWAYSDPAFMEMCPFKARALGFPDIYRGAMVDAYRILRDGEGPAPVVAEMHTERYLAFLPDANLPDRPSVRLKWWRAWSAQYVMAKEA